MTPLRDREQRPRMSHLWAALLLVLVTASALRFVGLGALSLIGDESYYWLWSRRPALAYYDHPAGVALLIRASTALGGPTPCGIRWLNALTGVACVLLTWRVGEQLLSRRAGVFAAAAVAVGAPFLVTSRFAYTDALSLCLMLMSVLAFWRLVAEGAGIVDGLAFGCILALLFNTKYSAYVYAAAVAGALLLDHRHLLRTRRVWAGAAVGVLGLIPVILWNAGHNWASLRWQLTHLTSATVAPMSFLGSMRHAWVYLTGPLVLLAIAGLGRIRTPGERLLTLMASFLLLPMMLSPMNSPRNLSTGLVPLLMLAGTRLPPHLRTRRQRAAASVFGSLLLGTALFGAGTVVNLSGPSPLPHSSVVAGIRRDATGLPALGATLKQEKAPIFALDYSLAAQIHYYAGRPAYTAWGQYRLWGIPSLQDVTVVSLDYVDPQLVTRRLQEAFQRVDGPQELIFAEPGATKVVHLWHAYNLQWDQESFLEHFDFLTIFGAAD